MQNEKKKNGFVSGIGFILAAAGSAVGLGNLWAFPFKTSANGGAAFVFVYIACVILIGAVTMVAEIYIGKRAQANTVQSFKKINKNFGFVGLIVMAIPFIISCYYSVLGGYTLKFAVNSFSGNVDILPVFSTNVSQVILFTLIFIFISLIIVMAGIKNGIESASKILMPILFGILVFIVIYSLCLGEGVDKGLNKYLNPDFYAFFHDANGNLSFNGLLYAMGQAFFSLSLGMGAIVCYGSYTGKEIKVGKSVAMICIFDTLVALLAGLAMFPAIGALLPEQLNSEGGVGLMFIVLPLVFEKMGIFGSIISFLFFAMVTIAAITSVISLIEVVTQFIVQNTRLTRKKSSLIITLLIFAFSIPIGISLGRVGILEESGINLFGYDLLTFLDESSNTVLMPLGAFAACLGLGWIFGKKESKKDWFSIKTLSSNLKNDGLDLGKFTTVFAVMVKYVTPVLILILEVAGIITNVNTNKNYWFIVLFALLIITVGVIVYFKFFKNKELGDNALELEKEKTLEKA